MTKPCHLVKAAERESHMITSQTDDPLLAAVHDSLALISDGGGAAGAGGDGDAGSSRDVSPAAETPQVFDV